jgi:hypothetical protein
MANRFLQWYEIVDDFLTVSSSFFISTYLLHKHIFFINIWYHLQGEDEDEDEEDVSESGIQPPCYTPPEIPSHLLPPEKVVVTQPTPEIEHPDMKKAEVQEGFVKLPNYASIITWIH